MKVYVEPENVWKYFYNNFQRMKDEVVIIGEEPETDSYVAITEEEGFPSVLAYLNGTCEYKEKCRNSEVCSEATKDLYNGFLAQDTKCDDEDITLEDTLEEEGLIYEREDELTSAFESFMTVVLDDPEYELLKEYPDELKEIFEEFINIVVIKHGFCIRRPMYVEEKPGEVVFKEYPYNEE